MFKLYFILFFSRKNIIGANWHQCRSVASPLASSASSSVMVGVTPTTTRAWRTIWAAYMPTTANKVIDVTSLSFLRMEPRCYYWSDGPETLGYNASKRFQIFSTLKTIYVVHVSFFMHIGYTWTNKVHIKFKSNLRWVFSLNIFCNILIRYYKYSYFFYNSSLT